MLFHVLICCIVQAYNYDDHLLTEEWMLSFQDKSSSVESATDDEVIRTQIESVLDIMKVCTFDTLCFITLSLTGMEATYNTIHHYILCNTIGTSAGPSVQ